MDNFITTFMNYKVSRLVEYGLVFCSKNTPFTRSVLRHYFRTYISNYYYGTFYTIEDEEYSRGNLKLEFQGLKEELLADYRSYELELSEEEYKENQKMIGDLLDLCYELVEIDLISIDEKDDIDNVVQEFLNKHEKLKDRIGDRTSKLVSLVRETYNILNLTIVCFVMIQMFLLLS